MEIKPPRHQIRYGAPWHHGERHRRYHVFHPPKWLQTLWDIKDPIEAWLKYLQMYFSEIVGLIIGTAFLTIRAAIGIYVFFWWCLPVVIETLF